MKDAKAFVQAELLAAQGCLVSGLLPEVLADGELHNKRPGDMSGVREITP